MSTDTSPALAAAVRGAPGAIIGMSDTEFGGIQERLTTQPRACA